MKRHMIRFCENGLKYVAYRERKGVNLYHILSAMQPKVGDEGYGQDGTFLAYCSYYKFSWG